LFDLRISAETLERFEGKEMLKKAGIVGIAV
jgi:hypothetical protein